MEEMEKVDRRKQSPRAERSVIKIASNSLRSCKQVIKQCSHDVSQWRVYRTLKTNPYIRRQTFLATPKCFMKHKTASIEYARANMHRA